MTAEDRTHLRLLNIRKQIQGVRVAMRDEYASRNCRVRVLKLLDRATLLVDMELRRP